METLEQKNENEENNNTYNEINNNQSNENVINVKHLKGLFKNRLEGMDALEYAFTYLSLIQLKQECNKTFVKQFFLPTKHDKEYIIHEFNYINKKAAKHPASLKLKKQVRNRLKYLFIDIDKENETIKKDTEFQK